MVPRDPQEPHRVASVLELFFDLVFVIAVSTAGASAHHSIVHEHSIQPIIMYLLAFEFIWWAWTNFSWFASSFDTDDWLYRLLTFVQMLGVLVLAAGIEPMFTAFDCRLAALGYVIMRIALVTQWLRAWLTPHPQAQQAQSQHTQALQTQSQESASPTQHLAQQRAKQSAKLYAIGIFVLQIFWLLWAFAMHPGPLMYIALALLVVAEWAVPAVAEYHGPTLWHPHHITERYGLFTIILLGESLLSSATALLEALHEGEHLGALLTVCLATFIISACLWWIYFWPTHHHAITSFRQVFMYAYSHYIIFASIDALSIGTELIVDYIKGNDAVLALPQLSIRLVYSLPLSVAYYSRTTHVLPNARHFMLCT